MPADDRKTAEHTELTARIERFKRLLGSFTDPGVVNALHQGIADLEARLRELN